MSARTRYTIVTPVRDEAAWIAKTIDSVSRQTHLPARWIIVDDGSTDGTGALLDNLAGRLPWLTVIHRDNRGYRAAGSGVMDAFYAGFAQIEHEPWEYVVKLDGDLSFAADYFERCLGHFSADPLLGIGGGTVCAPDGRGGLKVDSIGDPPFHVRGATKIYRRDCWRDIAPLLRAPGWDTLDEVRANFRGWHTSTFADLLVVQHKPTGSADGRWANAFKNGRANYLTGYHPAFMAAKCIRRLFGRPFGLESGALMSGYLTGYLKRLQRPADDGVVAYLRGQQLRRLLLQPSIYGGQRPPPPGAARRDTADSPTG